MRVVALQAWVGLLAAVIAGRATADDVVVVALSPDVPPYVMEGGTSGLEPDIVRLALPDRSLRFVQLPYGELETAVAEKKAAVALGVEPDGSGGAYSRDFLTFANVAISRKADDLRIESVADLASHRVIAWQDAWRELGEAFERQYAPGAPARAGYTEVPDQREQVELFFATRGSVIVIDRSIFAHFSAALGHAADEVTLHALFAPVTDFKACFADAGLRDEFDRGVAELCRSGVYGELLAKRGVVLDKTVCE